MNTEDDVDEWEPGEEDVVDRVSPPIDTHTKMPLIEHVY
jgi:hypothetical protein